MVMDNIQTETVRLVEWLSEFGKDPAGGVSRLLYSDVWTAAQKLWSSTCKRKDSLRITMRSAICSGGWKEASSRMKRL